MNRYPRRIIVTSITVFNCINYVNTVHQPILRGRYSSLYSSTSIGTYWVCTVYTIKQSPGVVWM